MAKEKASKSTNTTRKYNDRFKAVDETLKETIGGSSKKTPLRKRKGYSSKTNQD